eukprot:GCRY01006819.1.p3 GENE.GCRY01006819.1~~GCRY01006819.1.p3  ORF type:complete len:131 (+),score=41.83 GCRY01006819.1:121-513(+)
MFICLAIPFAIIAFLSQHIVIFLVVLFFCEFFLFATTGPINGALLSAVPEYFRTSAMAFSVFTIHLLGDMPSPTIIGWLFDHTHSMHFTMVGLALWLLWAVLFWGLGARVAEKRMRDEILVDDVITRAEA